MQLNKLSTVLPIQSSLPRNTTADFLTLCSESLTLAPNSPCISGSDNSRNSAPPASSPMQILVRMRIPTSNGRGSIPEPCQLVLQPSHVCSVDRSYASKFCTSISVLN